MAKFFVVAAAICAFAIGTACQTQSSDVRTMLLTAQQSGTPTPELVRELAKTDKAVPALLAIAITPWANGDNRHTAIEELSKMGREDSADALAQLLVPHQPLRMREEAANGLLKSPCKVRCTRSVLSYLYRRSQGERNKLESLKITSPEMQREFAADDAKITATLHEVLRKLPNETLDALVTVYGIGTEQPSAFGLAAIKELRLTEGCDLLLRSEHMQLTLQKGGEGEPTNTKAVIKELGCRSAVENPTNAQR